MIFTALGLLLVAAGLLVAGIAKSSVALLMTSLLVTIASGVVLALVLPAARRLSEATGANPGVVGATPQGQPVVLYVQQAPAGMPAAPAPTIDLTTPAPVSSSNGAQPLLGYDLLTAKQVNQLLDGGDLTPEQLEAIRAYESTHAARRTVLGRLDKMLASA